MTTTNLIFVGSFATTDPSEGDYEAERASKLVGESAYGSSLQIVAVELNDGGDGVMLDDDYGTTDTFSYDLGQGSVTQKTDATLKATVRVADANGDEQDVEVLLVQATNGDLFLSDLENPGPLDNLEISSVEILSIDGDSYRGWKSVHSVEGSSIVPTGGDDRQALSATVPDGQVDGEATGETMVLGYDDSNAPTDQGGDKITTGDDLIFGNGGDDYIDGDAGNDVIYGDTGGAINQTFDREVLEWSKAPGFGNGSTFSGFTQTTGDVTVTVSATQGDDPVSLRYSTLKIDPDNVDTGDLGPINDNSSLRFRSDQDEQAGTVTVSFSEDVQNVDFHISDLDVGASLSIFAYDASGTRVEVSFVDAGSKIKIVDEDGDGIFETVEDTTPDFGDGRLSDVNAVGVEIAGPVSRIEIIYDAESDLTSKTFISDIYFDAVTDPIGGEPGDGNDTLLGGIGDDTIYGEGGDDAVSGGEGSDELYGNQGSDTIDGGAGADTMDGGDGEDTIRLGRTDDGDPDSPVDGDADIAIGGADADTFLDVGVGDFVDGSATGNDDDTLDLRGSAPTDGSLAVNITGPDSDGNGYDGTVDYFDNAGNLIGSATFENIENIVPCFTPGTLIATSSGEVPVEKLKVGDRVITRDNGIQEIRWIGYRGMTRSELAMAPHLKPIRIGQGALEYGLPERDMLVSPNHRFLVAGDKTALYFEESEVLVAAKHLTDIEGVEVAEVDETIYIHLMFDQHEVILSDGAWSESFQPGDMTLNAMGEEQREELYELFPELRTREGVAAYCAARRSLKKHEARLLIPR